MLSLTMSAAILDVAQRVGGELVHPSHGQGQRHGNELGLNVIVRHGDC